MAVSRFCVGKEFGPVTRQETAISLFWKQHMLDRTMDDEATHTFGFRFTMHICKKSTVAYGVLLVESASSPSAQQDNQMM